MKYRVQVWDDFEPQPEGALIGQFDRVDEAIALARAEARFNRAWHDCFTKDGPNADGVEIDRMTSWTVHEEGGGKMHYLSSEDPEVRCYPDASELELILQRRIDQARREGTEPFMQDYDQVRAWLIKIGRIR